LVAGAALAGAANEVFTDLFPVSGHYRDPGAALSVATLLIVPALVFVADAAAGHSWTHWFRSPSFPGSDGP
jgi:hypothetical protein